MTTAAGAIRRESTSTSPCQCSWRLSVTTMLASSLLSTGEFLVSSKVACALRLEATGTGFWCWSTMLVVRARWLLFRWRDRKLGGLGCRGTGARIGRLICSWLARACRSRWPQAMGGLSSRSALCLRTGNLGRTLRGGSSRGRGCDYGYNNKDWCIGIGSSYALF